MVKFQFTLWLYAFTTGVQALNQAVPYELLYMYSVYKAEYRVFPAGARTVASGCKSAHEKENDDAMQYARDSTKGHELNLSRPAYRQPISHRPGL